MPRARGGKPKEVKAIQLYTPELVNGKIPHNGVNDRNGVFLCDKCKTRQIQALLVFWRIWHLDNGYSEKEIKEWTRRIGKSPWLQLP